MTRIGFTYGPAIGMHLIDRIKRKFCRIKSKVDHAWFDFRCAAIYKTPPVKCDPSSNVMIVTQLYPPVVTMYMLAAKSLARYVRPKGFVIVDDGLGAEDKRILSDHFEVIRFVSSESMRRKTCPAGGCWERLLTLSEANKTDYVIQLDADTLTLAEPTEVLQSISTEQSFTLGTSSGTHFVDLEEASHYAFMDPDEHVQSYAERALGQYPDRERYKYVRGCAGFTGFAPKKLTVENIEKFSTQMEKLVGQKKWSEWGSEQVASNFMAANIPGSMVLPVERYPFWKHDIHVGRAVFVHFFGTFRFVGGMYLRQSLRIIKQLNS